MNIRAAILGCAIAAAVPHATAASPYINCAAARGADERTICRTPGLIQRDAELATLYRVVTGLVAMGQRGALRDEQVDWLRARKACGTSVQCLRNHYDDRIAELDGYVQRIADGGPY